MWRYEKKGELWCEWARMCSTCNSMPKNLNAYSRTIFQPLFLLNNSILSKHRKLNHSIQMAIYLFVWEAVAVEVTAIVTKTPTAKGKQNTSNQGNFSVNNRMVNAPYSYTFTFILKCCTLWTQHTHILIIQSILHMYIYI